MFYAIEDFYAALRDFAKTHDLNALSLPAPELFAIEGSGEMQRFTHHFSERARRTSGPLGAQWRAVTPGGVVLIVGSNPRRLPAHLRQDPIECQRYRPAPTRHSRTI